MTTEQERADAGEKKRHPVVRLILENPISAFNTAAILFGGGFVWASNEYRMEKMENRIATIEQRQAEDRASAGITVSNAANEVRTLSRDLSDVKVTVRGIETAVQFLVQQARDSNGRPPSRSPQ